MSRSTVLKLNRYALITELQKNAGVLLFAVLYAAGLLTGCLMDSAGVLPGISDSLFCYLVGTCVSSGFARILFASFLLPFAFLFCVYLFGTSLLGIAFVPVFVVLDGVAGGLISGLLYVNYGLSGVAFNLLILSPCNCIGALCLIAAAVHSLKLSYTLSRFLFAEGQSAGNLNIRRYAVSFATLTLICAIGAMIQALFSIAFRSFFGIG